MPPSLVHPASEPDRESLFAAAAFTCDHMAQARLTGDWMPLPHAGTSDKIYAVTAGRGRLWLDGERYDLSAGQALFLPAGLWQRGVSESADPLTKTYMHFTSLTGGTLHLLRFYPPPVRLGGASAQAVIQLMAAAQAEWDANRPGRQLALKATLIDMLLHAYRAPASDHLPPDAPGDAGHDARPASRPDAAIGRARIADPQYDVIRRSLSHLSANLHRPITLTDLADHAGLSPSHFNRLFARLVGLPPMRFLEQERLRRAQALLAVSDQPIARIAARCGYGDPNYFSRVFQQRVGCPPSAYRLGLTGRQAAGRASDDSLPSA